MITKLPSRYLNIGRILLALQFALVASGCASTKPRVAHVKGAMTEGHAYRTYALVEHPINVGTVDAKMEQAIVEAMNKAGYEPSDTPTADLHVQYGMLVSQNPKLNGLSQVAVAGNPHHGFAGGELLVASDSSTAESRKVVVIMAGERATNRVVWMGVSSHDVAEGALEAAAIDAVQQVMATFPVRDQWDDIVAAKE